MALVNFAKESLRKIIKRLRVSRKILFYRFGYNPTGYLRNDLFSYFFGTKNLYKHYQAKKIFEALDIAPSDNILDFGWGSGYMTVELSKNSKTTTGIDINPNVTDIPIPDFLSERLNFSMINNHFVEKEKGVFDKILLSEVILSVPDKVELLKSCSSLLKSNGKIVIVNGLGKYFIKKTVFENRFFHQFLTKIFSYVPKSYMEYENNLCSVFGNSAKAFMKENEIIEFMNAQNFSLINKSYSPKTMISNIIEAHQFYNFIRKKNTMGNITFLLFKLLFSFINIFQKNTSPSGFIGVFQKI